VPLPKVFFLFQEDQKAIYLCRAEQKSKKKRKKCNGEHRKKKKCNIIRTKKQYTFAGLNKSQKRKEKNAMVSITKKKCKTSHIIKGECI
jgi:hypothetical protein